MLSLCQIALLQKRIFCFNDPIQTKNSVLLSIFQIMLSFDNKNLFFSKVKTCKAVHASSEIALKTLLDYQKWIQVTVNFNDFAMFSHNAISHIIPNCFICNCNMIQLKILLCINLNHF